MNSPFPWPGGKRALKRTLLDLLPPHDIYAEVFAGSAKLLFAKEPAVYEIVNDLNGDVANFFRVAKHRAAELAERLELECVHAERFRELRAQALKPADCEIDRALRFAYLVWYSYGSKGEHFAGGSARVGAPRRPLDRVQDLLAATAKRLRRVLIEQRDFAEVLTRYDSADTFFYLDPPYVHFQPNGRYESLTAERRVELFDRLSGIAGKFLLSFDDCDEVRTLAQNYQFECRSVDVIYTLSDPGHRSARPELLLANYPLEPASAEHAGASAQRAALAVTPMTLPPP